MNRSSGHLLIVLAILAHAGCQPSRRPMESESSSMPPAATSPHRAPEQAAVRAPMHASTAPAFLQALVGKTVRVQFRRDALGMAVSAPLPPTSEGVGGRPAYIEGTLTSLTASWVTLSRSDVTYHIPHAAILLIESRE